MLWSASLYSLPLGSLHHLSGGRFEAEKIAGVMSQQMLKTVLDVEVGHVESWG